MEMELSALRPSSGSNVVDLGSRFANKEWMDLLPSALPDALLLLLANDFRTVELVSLQDEDDPEPRLEYAGSMAVALYVVMSLLNRLPNSRKKRDEIRIPEAGVFHAIKLYQLVLEREIVSRITGLSADFPSEMLANQLLACLEMTE